MKKGIKIAVCALTAAALVSSAVAYFRLGYSKKYEDTRIISVGDGRSLRVGIISDTQLPSSGDRSSTQAIALRKSLETMKQNSVEVLIHAGDFTDLSSREAWKLFSDIYDEVYGDDKPVPVFAMGNHDYWLDYFSKSREIATPAKLQRRFTEYTGEYPYSHKVINGYHFIVWSSSDGSYDKSYDDSKWIREQLDAAVVDAPDKPIFVITHLNAQDTVYGSDDWGNQDIYDVLKDYPQVVSFSGHSHYALCDERSIWQGEFTAINTQTTDYIELESGKYNGSIPVDAYSNPACYRPMGMIMTVEDQQVTIERVDAVTGDRVKAPWVIKAPFGDTSAFNYTREHQTAQNSAPFFQGNINAVMSDAEDKDGRAIKVLSFAAAHDDDFVHSYRLEFLSQSGEPVLFEKTDYSGNILKDEDGGESFISELMYFSDFTKGLDKMSDTVLLRLPANLPESVTDVRLTAIDSFGLSSDPVTEKLR